MVPFSNFDRILGSLIATWYDRLNINRRQLTVNLHCSHIMQHPLLHWVWVWLWYGSKIARRVGRWNLRLYHLAETRQTSECLLRVVVQRTTNVDNPNNYHVPSLFCNVIKTESNLTVGSEINPLRYQTTSKKKIKKGKKKTILGP